MIREKLFGKKRWAALALAGLLALTLAGCAGSANGGQQAPANSTAAHAPAEDSYLAEPEMADGAWDMAGEADGPVAEAGAATAGGPTLTLPQDGRKVILTAWLTVETLEYDSTCTLLQQAAAQTDGYVSATNISGNTVGHRVASFTMRIPAGQYGEFMRLAGEAGNVVSRNEHSEEVTQQITDIASRLKALRTKEDRLLALMEEAKRMDDLLLLEDQLSEVLYEIERYTASQKDLEQQVAYSTVDITVHEVRQITEQPQDSYGAQVGQAFSGSWAAFARFFQNLWLGIVWALPVLLVLAVILVVVLLLVRRARKKRAANPPAPTGVASYPPYPPYPAPPNTQATPAAEEPPPTK